MKDSIIIFIGTVIAIALVVNLLLGVYILTMLVTGHL